MDKGLTNEPMLDIFIYETAQNIEQLETAILASEKANCFSPNMVNEIFRIMHTIKGSASMMMYNNLTSLSHALEDLFYFIREEKPEQMDCAILSDIVLAGVDFIKLELEKVKNRSSLDGDPSSLIEDSRSFLSSIKGQGKLSELHSAEKEAAPPQQYYLSSKLISPGAELKCYEAVIFFDDDCEMENIRAFTITHNLKNYVQEFSYTPHNIIENHDSARMIREQGFRIVLRSDKDLDGVREFFSGAMFVRSLELRELSEEELQGQLGEGQGALQQEDAVKASVLQAQEQIESGPLEIRSAHQGIISVDVVKLDKLMDLMGEMVIAEAMVTQNPELKSLKLNSFYKAARQLQKITSEMQDMVMSIRMVPLSATFHKMQRIVRDMGRKLSKDVELTLIGANTEVDKNIIEHISDPLMHLVRNAIDHGIEAAKERSESGKPLIGQITLEAQTAGSDVLITVRDDGKGLNKEAILRKAMKNGLLNNPEKEMADREIYNLIFLPGFSTKENVTEFSGRGVGMDVVTKNLEAVGGSVTIDSEEGAGTLITLKIPLTLAIIDGMNIRVGKAKYTIPTTSIKETFRVRENDLFNDLDGNELIMVRGQCYPILRIHEIFAVKTETTKLTKGIMLMIEHDGRSLCIFADELLGQHQVVVKALPSYMKSIRRVEGLAGCALLGDGTISLILNISELVKV
ncbi:MAG: CheA signal transduction histidine kinase [Bacillota bacterium]|nr:CheA signal transduction histidine kinase [Bacillota bacterium]